MYRTFSCKKKKSLWQYCQTPEENVFLISNLTFNLSTFELCNYSILLLPSIVNTCTDFFKWMIILLLTVWRPKKMIYNVYRIYDFNILSKSRHPNFCIIFMSVDRQKQNTCTNIKKTFWFLFGQNRDINNITKQ